MAANFFLGAADAVAKQTFNILNSAIAPIYPIYNNAMSQTAQRYLGTYTTSEPTARQNAVVQQAMNLQRIVTATSDALRGNAPPQQYTAPRAPAPPSIQDTDTDDDPAILKDITAEYLLNTVLLSQLTPEERQRRFAEFEEDILKNAFGKYFDGFSYSPFKSVLYGIMGQKQEKMSKALYTQTSSTVQMYLVATFVPYEHMGRPEVGLAIAAPLDTGEFYERFSHIMMTIMRERITSKMIELRTYLSRLEYLCRVYRYKSNPSYILKFTERDAKKLAYELQLLTTNVIESTTIENPGPSLLTYIQNTLISATMLSLRFVAWFESAGISELIYRYFFNGSKPKNIAKENEAQVAMEQMKKIVVKEEAPVAMEWMNPYQRLQKTELHVSAVIYTIGILNSIVEEKVANLT